MDPVSVKIYINCAVCNGSLSKDAPLDDTSISLQDALDSATAEATDSSSWIIGPPHICPICAVKLDTMKDTITDTMSAIAVKVKQPTGGGAPIKVG